MSRFFFAFIFLVASTALGDFDFLPLSGRVFSDAYVPVNNNFPSKPLEQLSTSLWLQTNPHWNDQTYAKVIYQGDGFDGNYSSLSGSSTVTHLESTLREGYFSTSGDGWEIRAGRQIIPWGKSDAFNPTDYLTGKNLSFFNPDDEVRRIGSDSVWASVTPLHGTSPWTFTLVWTPYFAQGSLLFPPSVLPANVSLSNPAGQTVTFLNSEVAIKASFAGQGWDGSLSAFNGWGHLPELQEVSHILSGSTVLINVTQVYRRIAAFGSDASVNLGQWVIRGESAYTITPNDDGTNPLMEPTHWDTVLGAERPLGNNFRLQGQLLVRIFPHYTSPSQVSGPDPVSTQVDQQIAQANALLLQYQDPTRPGGTLRVSYTTDNQLLNAEIFFLQNFAGGDYLLRPRVEYAWTDLVKTSVGAELYGGSVTRPLGALNPYSAFFIEGKVMF